MGMIAMRICCGKPPIVLAGKDDNARNTFSVVCGTCRLRTESNNRESAVKDFNEKSKRGKQNV